MYYRPIFHTLGGRGKHHMLRSSFSTRPSPVRMIDNLNAAIATPLVNTPFYYSVHEIQLFQIPHMSRYRQVTTTDAMAQHPYATMFGGMTFGYFVAMYFERTKYKDEYVRDERHRPGVGIPGVSK